MSLFGNTATNHPRQKVGSGIFAGLAANVTSDKTSLNSRGLSEALAGLRDMKAFSTGESQEHDEEDEESTGSSSSAGSSDETESSDSSITRVESQEAAEKKSKKSSKVASGDHNNNNRSGSEKSENNIEQKQAKARAKVSASMILSDFSSSRQSQKPSQQGQYGESKSYGPDEVWSEVPRSIDQCRNNSVRRQKASSATIVEEPLSYRSNNNDSYSPITGSRKVSFDSNADPAKSEVSWESDSGQNNPRRVSARSAIILEENTRNQSQWSNHPSEVRSEISFRRDTLQTVIKPKSKSAVEYNNSHSYYQPEHRNVYPPQYSSITRARSPSGTPKSWSEVVYRNPEAQTELSHRSDPGPTGHRRPTVKVDARVPLPYDFEDPYNHNYSSHSETKHKQKVSASAMIDVTDLNYEEKPRRKVTAAAQMNTSKENIYYDDIEENWQDKEEQEEIDEGEDTEREEKCERKECDEKEDDLSALPSDPKLRKKFIDLKTTNESLLTLKATLESTVKEQSAKIEQFKSLESVVAAQQEQLDHITKVEELMQELSTKISAQEAEMKILRGKLIEAESDFKNREQSRASIFYDPRLLPLNSLPRIIFDRAYDDFTILFTVITSLLYTIYVFPVIVIAKSAKELADRSRAKIQELTGETTSANNTGNIITQNPSSLKNP